MYFRCLPSSSLKLSFRRKVTVHRIFRKTICTSAASMHLAPRRLRSFKELETQQRSNCMARSHGARAKAQWWVLGDWVRGDPALEMRNCATMAGLPCHVFMLIAVVGNVWRQCGSHLNESSMCVTRIVGGCIIMHHNYVNLSGAPGKPWPLPQDR